MGALCAAERFFEEHPPSRPCTAELHAANAFMQTWAGIQAAKQLESKGIATQLSLVFCMTQAVAGAQAGTSVLQLSVARVREW